MNAVRATALTILLKIDQQNAYAAPLLARAMMRFQARDRRLLVDLVYGSLRWRKTLDWIIEQFSRRPLRRVDLPTLNLLRLGVYQLVYLSRIPPHAAVSTSVTLAKSFCGLRGGGFVNAILRRIAEKGKAVLDSLPEGKTVDALALRTSHPEWLVRRWMRQFGYDETEALCRANNVPPPAILRVNPQKTTKEELCEKSTSNPLMEGVQVEPTRFSRYGLRILPLSAVYGVDWLREGYVTIQDEGSQLVGEIVTPSPGERILDACAGIGVKALQLCEITREPHDLLCLDSVHWKLVQLRANARRLGFASPPCVVARAERGPLANRPIFDKVLVDAPCSNTGVLRRHPERKWRLRERDIARLAEGQLALLDAVAPWVIEGGRLVYSTCSLEWEEGEEVISRFLGLHGEFSIEDCGRFLREEAASFAVEGLLRTFPHRGGMDGFFCARLVRRHP